MLIDTECNWTNVTVWFRTDVNSFPSELFVIGTEGIMTRERSRSLFREGEIYVAKQQQQRQHDETWRNDTDNIHL